MKRLLAGCLAVLLLFSDASSVLASNLSEPIVGETEITESLENTESTESSETTEFTEKETGTEASANTEQVESTEEGASTETTEIVEESELTESTEEGSEFQEEENTEAEPETETEAEIGLVEEIVTEPGQVQVAPISDYIGPIYSAYLGISEALRPRVAQGYYQTDWEGEILYFGAKAWRMLDPATGLLGSTGIFLDSNTLCNKYNDAYIWDAASVLNTALSDYINLPDVTTFNELEKGAISEFRLMTLDEATNPAYGFYNPDGSYEGQDSTKVMYLSNSSYNHRLYSGDTEEQIWVEYNGRICRIPYSEDEGTLRASITNTLQGKTYGYAPVLKLNKDEIFMTVFTGIVSNYTQYDISLREDRTWRVLLYSDESGFAATVPETAAHKGTFLVDITDLGTGTYDKVCVVLVDENGQVAYYGDLCEDLEEPATGTYTVYLPEEINPGTYDIKVFGENSEEAYVSNIVEKELDIQGPTATN